MHRRCSRCCVIVRFAWYIFRECRYRKSRKRVARRRAAAVFRQPPSSSLPDHVHNAPHLSRRHAAQQQLLTLLLWWLYGGVATGVLRTFFYVTDSQPLKGAAVFYRKAAWRALEGGAIRQLAAGMLQVTGLPLSHAKKDNTTSFCGAIVFPAIP